MKRNQNRIWKRRQSLTESKLTVEGWIYLVILAFITVGSILRNVNLLVLMAGLMYAPLILHWRTGTQLLRTLRGVRSMPQRIYAGQTVTVPWTVTNRSNQTTAWNVSVEDQLKRSDPPEVAPAPTPPPKSEAESTGNRWLSTYHFIRRLFESRVESPALMIFDRVDGGQSRTGVWRVCFPRRGRYEVGPASVSAFSPLGLSVSRVHSHETKFCFVAPALGRLTSVWREKMQSFRSGFEAGSRRRGQDQEEFFALRPWRSGDSKKHIHWRTSARHGQPIVKQFDQNHDRDLALVLDLWTPPNRVEGTEYRQRAEVVLSFAATVVSRIGIETQGRVTIALCGAEPQFFSGLNQSDSVGAVMRALATAQTSDRSQLAESLLKTSAAVSTSTPIYVISTREQFPNLLEESATPVSQIGSAIRQKQLQRLQAMVTWLPVQSTQFGDLFAANEPSAVDRVAPVDQEVAHA